MAKAVMISIRPEWTAKILNGKKKLELRKNRPALRTPFKCYIYCTLDGLKHPFGKACGGRVVGEFICDEIKRISLPDNPTQNDLDMPIYENSCMSYEQIKEYIKDEDARFWHITELKIYDTPKPIGEFVGIRECNDGTELRYLEKAPQSWCYVLET